MFPSCENQFAVELNSPNLCQAWELKNKPFCITFCYISNSVNWHFGCLREDTYSTHGLIDN